jgi:hypothetical protein
MTETDLIKRLAASAGTVPAQADVLGVRRYSFADLERRTKQLLASVKEAYNVSLDKGDWVQEKDRTLIRLPRGARAVVYHASGAMKLSTGLRGPMEGLFPKTSEAQDVLVKLLDTAAARLKLTGWVVGTNQALKFERLWKIKACATDRTAKVIEPVLCRAVGAYRHFIGELPVLGAASAAVKLAGDGSVDTLSLELRETTPEVVDRAAILPPEVAARQIVMQLSALMGRGKVPYTEVVVPESMRFGYLNLGKRTAQPVLAPVYLAQVSIAGDEAQGYVLATAATEKPYLHLARKGHEAPATSISRTVPGIAPVHL